MNLTNYIREEARKSIAQAIAFDRYLFDEGIDLRQDPIIGKLLAELAAPRPDRPDIAGAPTLGGTIKDPNRFELLQQAIRDGTAREKFPVGTIFHDTWTDTRCGTVYNMPLRIVHYGKIRISLSHADRPCLGAVLQRVHATPFVVPFDNRDSNYMYGSNRFDLSEIRQWLNSDQSAGCWWAAKHICDRPSLFTTDLNGYLQGCSAVLKEYLTESVLVERSIDLGVIKKLCRFFLPSAENLHIDVKDPEVELEDEAWDYYRDTPTDRQKPCSKRVFTDPLGTAQRCWLSSADRGVSYGVWNTLTDGSTNYCSANTTNACAPACVIA